MFQKLFGKAQESPVTQMSVQQLHDELSKGAAITLIDVRSPEEYAQDGHIAQAKLIPLPTLAARVSELPTDRPIALICRSGGRSQAACDVLSRLKFTNLSNVSGGMIAWQRAGLPVKR